MNLIRKEVITSLPVSLAYLFSITAAYAQTVQAFTLQNLVWERVYVVVLCLCCVCGYPRSQAVGNEGSLCGRECYVGKYGGVDKSSSSNVLCHLKGTSTPVK